MSSSLSATELSRLHRQRRLESSHLAHRVTPASIMRRAKKSSPNDSCSDDGGRSLMLTGINISRSFDDEATATISTTASANKGKTPEEKNSRHNHSRSFSFSSFSVPATTTEPVEDITSPPPATPTTVSKVVAAVTPPDSPGTSQRSTQSSNPSLSAFLESRPARRKSRPNMTRSSSSRSMPQPFSTPSPTRRSQSVTRSSPSTSAMAGLKMSSSSASLTMSSSYEAESMPMDELMATSSRGSSRKSSRLPPTSQRSLASLETPILATSDAEGNTTLELLPARSLPTRGNINLSLVPLSSNDTSVRADVSLQVMAHALQEQKPPACMSADEQHLWDVVQTLLKKNQGGTSTGEGSDSWEQKYKESEAEWEAQQKEHDRALRAIQRVLADVTTEREVTVLNLREELERVSQQRDDTILKLTSKLKEMQSELVTIKTKDAAASRDDCDVKESEEVMEMKVQLETMKRDLLKMQKAHATTEEEMQMTIQVLREDKAANEKKIEVLEQQLQEESTGTKICGNIASETEDELRKELQEKTASLENAKMIITSLENANGSLARELRAKLKEKEDELANLTSTSADRKRTLDNLATELRELQRHQHKPRLTTKQLANQKSLCQLLEKNVKALRKAAVEHEAQNDQASVDKISHIVSETFTSLKHNLESWETYMENSEELDENSNGGMDPYLESALVKKNEETKTLRKELDRIRAQSSQDILELQQEVNSLEEKLATNIELLAQKSRELSVLRDSLNLEDNGVGYISDDATEMTESDPVPLQFTPDKADTSFAGSLLLHGGAGVHSVNPNAAEMSDATAAEIQMLKNEIIKQQKEREAIASELKAEKESLANAKMIISSLEKANKSMLEDLRSRLQDSNTAIASLLEKSMEHEKTIATLRKELAEREKDGQQAKSQMAKLRDENLMFSMRLASKDKELEDLRNSSTQYEGQEVTISKVRVSSVEEKKEEDPVSDEG